MGVRGGAAWVVFGGMSIDYVPCRTGGKGSKR
jgi:hypothetical protein